MIINNFTWLSSERKTYRSIFRSWKITVFKINSTSKRHKSQRMCYGNKPTNEPRQNNTKYRKAVTSANYGAPVGPTSFVMRSTNYPTCPQLLSRWICTTYKLEEEHYKIISMQNLITRIQGKNHRLITWPSFCIKRNLSKVSSPLKKYNIICCTNYHCNNPECVWKFCHKYNYILFYVLNIAGKV